MGRTWSVEAGWDIYAMSEYHTIANFSESPVNDSILWAGTDDGLIQVTKNGGKDWRKIDLSDVEGVPATAYVNDIRADLFDANTVYVALDNHKYGDFKPYLIKSTDLGKTWQSLASALPEKHLVWRIVQDHVNKNLMFIGTEFGIFFTVDGGKEWVELNGGIPTISTRDVKIQRRENDLVAGTFGRGIYILDDYAPLRQLTESEMEKDALLIGPSRPVKWFTLDTNHTNTDGDDRYAAKNPEHGATLTYFLKDSLLTDKAQRQKAEKEMVKDKNYPKYPSWEAIEKENHEMPPAVYIEIRDADGEFVNRVEGKTSKGIHRVTWDMNYATSKAVTGVQSSGWSPFSAGLMAIPGTYSATLYKRVKGEVTRLAEPVEFELSPITNAALSNASRKEVLAFGKKIANAQRKATAVNAVLSRFDKTMDSLRTAIDRTPGEIKALESRYADIQKQINAINIELNGFSSQERMGTKPANITSRLGYAMTVTWSSYGPTQQHKDQFEYANKRLNSVSKQVSTLQQDTIPSLQQAVIDAGGPWTVGAPVIVK